MKSIKMLLIGLAILFYWVGPVLADYMLILKNGRAIIVEAYNENGGMIIFSGYGGKISIAKEEVKSIIPVKGIVTRTDLPEVEYVPKETGGVALDPERGVGLSEVPPLSAKGKAQTPEEIRAEKRAKEEKEYQKRIAEITQKIKATVQRYISAAVGGHHPGVCIYNCGKFIKGKVANMNSRIKDRLYDPARARGSRVIRVKFRSPFAGLPPRVSEFHPWSVKPPPRVRVRLPSYTPKERELSDLRKQIGQLQGQRDRLIQEMRQKGFDSGALFLG